MIGDLPLGTVGGFFVCTLAVALFTCQINNGILTISRLHLTTVPILFLSIDREIRAAASFRKNIKIPFVSFRRNENFASSFRKNFKS